MKATSVLIIDDDEGIRENMVMALELEGYDVHAVSNGRLGLEYLKTLPEERWPRCILLDLMMPEMDGITFLQIMQRDHAEDLARIAVVVTTAKGSPISPAQVPSHVRCLQKPMELELLYETVREHCG